MRAAGRRCLLLCLCALFALSGCSALHLASEPAVSAPALQLLSMPAYRDVEREQARDAEEGDRPMVDLWLDASQVMGGINAHSTSVYPHHSRKYREGGFHYRYGDTVGWYESVLQNVLGVTEDLRVRVLRAGNERLTDAFLQSAGFSFADGEALRSLRRDLLTYAVDPLPSLFAEFSAPNMEGSFYSLGTPKLNQTARFGNGEALENPDAIQRMSETLDRVISAFAAKDTAAAEPLLATGNDSPLHYALSNLDLTRLSFITCDPATLRRLSGNAADGSRVNYLETLLRERGVFDAGCAVGLYAMTLDYMGQITSWGAADFEEPLIWGRLEVSAKTKKDVAAMPMPRVLLMLVVGQPAWVRRYTAALNARLDQSAALNGLRGPSDGQLSYTANGLTVEQQPFSFAYHYTEIARPSVGYYTQHTSGAALSVAGQEDAVNAEQTPLTVTLAPSAGNASLRYTWPAEALPAGARLNLDELRGARVEVIDSLLLTGTRPNTADAAPVTGDGTQALCLRDTVYLFARQEAPFADDPAQSPFTLSSVALSEDGKSVTATVAADASKLRAGYYRLRLSADVSGGQLSWPAVPWAEEESGLSADFDNSLLASWMRFEDVFARYARQTDVIPRQFDHAWGKESGASYKGVEVPDCPPVYRALYLHDLLSQLQAAASVETAPYIRCVFDVFVPGV